MHLMKGSIKFDEITHIVTSRLLEVSVYQFLCWEVLQWKSFDSETYE